jgi:HEAT repeats
MPQPAPRDHEVNHLSRQQQRDLVLSLVIVPGRGRRSSPAEVLGRFGTADGPALGLKLLRDAIERHDGTGVETGLIVGFTYGLTADHLEPLLELSSADWHQRHEDVVIALRDLHTPAAVTAFVHATRWIPAYLDFDESRALARKAIHALGETPGPEARQALTELAGSDDEILRETARRVLERRQIT